MKQSRAALQSGIRGAKAALKYIVISLSAILTSVILSVLFSVTAVAGSDGILPDGGIVIALKPAYLFSVPAEGDRVIYEGAYGISGGRNLKTGVYDGEDISMEMVRGKIIAVVPFSPK